MENIKKIFTIGIGVATALFGWIGWLALAFCFSMLLDYITGTAVDIKDKRWSSSVARSGLWKKLGSIIAVLVAGLTDGVLYIVINNLQGYRLPFDYSFLLCPIVLIWYILTEIVSIIENAAKMGAPIPPFLKQNLAILQKNTETEAKRKKK